MKKTLVVHALLTAAVVTALCMLLRPVQRQISCPPVALPVSAAGAIIRFAHVEIAGDDLPGSFRLATDSFRNGLDCRGWVASPPVAPLRSIDWLHSSYQPLGSDETHLLAELTMQPAGKSREEAQTFLVEATTLDGRHWQIVSCRRSYGPPLPDTTERALI